MDPKTHQIAQNGIHFFKIFPGEGPPDPPCSGRGHPSRTHPITAYGDSATRLRRVERIMACYFF